MKNVLKFYKYQGAGNDFLIADNRDGTIALTPQQIAALCTVVMASVLMV